VQKLFVPEEATFGTSESAAASATNIEGNSQRGLCEDQVHTLAICHYAFLAVGLRWNTEIRHVLRPADFAADADASDASVASDDESAADNEALHGRRCSRA
jgi:hypothetical protein